MIAKNIFQKSKKIISFLTLLFIICVFILPSFMSAEVVLLESYPGLEEVTENLEGGKSSQALASYIDFIVKYSIGLLSVGAVLSIIYAGIIYITTEIFSKKDSAKGIILRSIGALVLLLSSFIFFEEVNPELLNVRFEPLVAEENISEEDRVTYGNFNSDSDDDYEIENLKKIATRNNFKAHSDIYLTYDDTDPLSGGPISTVDGEKTCDDRLKKHKNLDFVYEDKCFCLLKGSCLYFKRDARYFRDQSIEAKNEEFDKIAYTDTCASTSGERIEAIRETDTRPATNEESLKNVSNDIEIYQDKCFYIGDIAYPKKYRMYYKVIKKTIDVAS